MIFEPGNFIAQPQLALFKPGQLQLVGYRQGGQSRDGMVKVAVFNPDEFQSANDFIMCHANRLATATARPQRPL